MCVREREKEILCVCVYLQLGAESEAGGYLYDGKKMDGAISYQPLSRGDENNTQHAARLVYEEGNG